MKKDLTSRLLRTLLGKPVFVKIYDGSELSGELTHVDRSEHGTLGNFIVRHNGRLTIVRGDAVRFVATDKGD